MTPSVAPEVEWELTEGAVYYAREGGAELGRAFISEFERVVAFLCTHPRIGAEWRNGRRRFPLRRFRYSVIYSVGKSFESSLLHTTAECPTTGPSVSECGRPIELMSASTGGGKNGDFRPDDAAVH